ncbi:PREDICTED: uncharacterized protein LOC105560201 [Vollenhovia emeryi]|uniref:uncharacterized protein LOC105560201 n=1 Tax=Vollenhovia emeryi TaxID=411798 RepID=UPI0005F4EDE8|nr:PREDICTED: uncharacterized protein LOC105560201 [Vollenhovia emeryi]
MGYKGLYLLVLAVAVIYVQAEPHSTEGGRTVTVRHNVMKVVDGMIDSSFESVEGCIMKTKIVKVLEGSCTALSKVMRKFVPETMISRITESVKCMVHAELKVFKCVLKLISNTMIVVLRFMGNFHGAHSMMKQAISDCGLPTETASIMSGIMDNTGCTGGALGGGSGHGAGGVGSPFHILGSMYNLVSSLGRGLVGGAGGAGGTFHTLGGGLGGGVGNGGIEGTGK